MRCAAPCAHGASARPPARAAPPASARPPGPAPAPAARARPPRSPRAPAATCSHARQRFRQSTPGRSAGFCASSAWHLMEAMPSACFACSASPAAVAAAAGPRAHRLLPSCACSRSAKATSLIIVVLCRPDTEARNSRSRSAQWSLKTQGESAATHLGDSGRNSIPTAWSRAGTAATPSIHLRPSCALIKCDMQRAGCRTAH